MFDNHIYNLFQQMTQEHKSLWRIKNMYMKDASNCDICKDFWKKIEESKEGYVRDLEKLIREHLR